MEIGIFMLLAGVLYGIGAVVDELKAIRKVIAPATDDGGRGE